MDIASPVAFRVVFGANLLYEVFRYFEKGWIERYYIRSETYFHYAGFRWLQPWPGIGMYVHFAALPHQASGRQDGADARHDPPVRAPPRGRLPERRSLDPEVDLAKVERTLGHATWVLPLTTPL